jgi:HK97 gp10 family phage protein
VSSRVKFKIEGFKEFEDLLTEIQEDFGPKDQRKILNNAVKMSMASVLNTARRMVPADTGALRASLRLEVRKPSGRDRRSKYVAPGDIVIGSVTTAPGNVLAKKTFKNLKTGEKQKGIPSDARAIANEFGTANMAAKPYLRPAMEVEKNNVVNDLGSMLSVALQKYKAKQAKKGI